MSSDLNEKSDKSVEKSGTQAPTMLGWIARFLSVIFIMGLAGTIGYQVISENRPIAFTTEIVVENIRQEGDVFFIPVDVTNEGSLTATAVDMELTVGGEVTEIEISMIGANETVSFVVTRPQRSDSVEHEVISYEGQ